MPWRLYDENGQAQCDLIAMDGEVIEAGKPVTMVNLDSDAIERIVTIIPTRVRQLLVPHILNGELAIELPSIAEKKAYIAKQLTEETWESELRIEMPHKHYVNMTPAVLSAAPRCTQSCTAAKCKLDKTAFLLYYMSCCLQDRERQLIQKPLW